MRNTVCTKAFPNLEFGSFRNETFYSGQTINPYYVGHTTPMNVNDSTTLNLDDVFLSLSFLYLFGLIFFLLLFVFISWGLLEKMREGSFDAKKNSGHRGSLWIWGLMIVHFLWNLMHYLMNTEDFDETNNRCSELVTTSVLSWIIAKQLIYFFLYERAVVVHKSLRVGRKLALLRSIVGVVIVFGVSLAFYWTAFLNFHGRVSIPEQKCVLNAHWDLPYFLFAGLDFVLSFCLLFIFAYPLYQHTQNMKSQNRVNPMDSGEVKVSKMLRWNFYSSCFISLSAVASLIALGVCHSATVFSFETNSKDDFRILSLSMIAPTLDLLICSIVVLSLCSAWKPKFVRFFFQAIMESGSSKKSPPVAGATLANETAHSHTIQGHQVSKSVQPSKIETLVVSSEQL